MTNVLVKKILLLVFMRSMLFTGSISAQSINYGYFFNLANGADANPITLLTTGEANPQGMTFSADGSKLFVVGQQSDEVNQYTLTTPFDITSGVTHNGFYTVASQGGLPYDVAFSTSGNKMFVLNSGEVDQYSLTTPFDITSGVTHDGSPYGVTGQEASPQSLTFSDDGTKMFVIGTSGNDVNQYTLTSPFDVTSTVTFNGNSISLSTQVGTAYGITFGSSGTKMYIVNTNRRVYQYSLSTAYVVTSGVSYDGVEYFGGSGVTIGSSRDVAFNEDGDRMFFLGQSTDNIAQYDINPGGFTESLLNDGSVDGSIEIFIEGETFTNAGGSLGSKTDYAISNLPAGVFPNIAVAGDGSSATLTLSGAANDHQDLNDLSSLVFTFVNSAFTGSNAGSVANSTAASSQLGIDFEDNNPKLTYGFAYDLTNAAVEGGPASVVSEDTGPTSVAFNIDGTKMFVLGNTGDDVNQYTLSVPFDLTAPITFDGSPYSVAGQTTSPWSLTFNNDGTKMYVITAGTSGLHQYSLANPFDVTSGVTYDNSLNISSEENQARDIAFSDDGTKMFLVGFTGDDVTQYSLTTPFDITGGTSVDGNPFSVASETTSPIDIAFNDDGTKMLILSSNPDWVYQYSLSTPYDITGSTTYDNVSFYVGLQEAFPAGMNFSANGSKMYVTGSAGDDINQYDLNVGGFNEVVDNDGSVEGSLTIRITDESFVNASGTLLQSTHYTISNLPVGLTPSLAVAGDGRSADLTLSGNATDHQEVDDISSLIFTFTNAAFSDSDASEVANAQAASSNIALDFDDNEAAVTYGFFHNLSNGATPGTSHSVAGEESSSQSVAFSDDGLTMLVLGSGDDEVNQYSLTTAFDVSSGVSHAGLFSVASEVTAPNGMTFSTDGTKMFLTGFENFGKIFQYSLTTPYVVTSGVSFDYFFNISGQEGTPQGIAFNTDGTKMYIVGSAGDEVNQYSLSTPFDVTLTSVTFDNVTFSVSGEDTFPTDITFNPEGTKMMIIGGVGKDINQYSLASPFDLSVGVTDDGTPFSISSEVFAPRGIAFNDDGSRLFVVGSNDGVNQYQVNVGGFEESGSNSGSVSGSLTIHIVEDTFTSQGGSLNSGSDYSIGNLPAGFTPTLAVAGDGLSATLTLSGNANDHQDDNDLDNLQFTFNNSAFTTLTASTIQNTDGASSNVGIDFNDNPYLDYGISFDLSNGATGRTAEFDISAQSIAPQDVAYNDDGTRMYVLQGSIFQYNLTTPYDISSGISYSGISYPAGGEGMAFGSDGFRLFIVVDGANAVRQYSLTNAYDISGGVALDGSFSVSTEETNPTDIRFSADGTKMFIVGFNSDQVRQYGLTTPYDITSGVSLDGSYDPSATAFNPSRLDFSIDGKKMFVDMHQFSLSTPFDITSGVTADGSSLFTGANSTGTRFHPDGKTISVADWTNDVVAQYDIITGGFTETEENDGSMDGSLVVSITGNTFTNAGSTLTPTTDYSISNLPSGLTPTLTVAADGLTATLTLSAKALGHQDTDDLEGLEFTFENSAFTNTSAASVIDAVGFTANDGIDFDNNFPVLAYDYANNPANYVGAGRFGVLAQEGSTQGVTFNADGTKVYIVGTVNDQIFQYSLSTAYDVTTASLDGNSVSLNPQDDSPLGITFNNVGTSLFVAAASSATVLEYTLTTPYDVTTGFSYSNNSLDVSAAGSPGDLAFSADGMELFTVSGTTDQVSQFSLTTPFNISSGVTLGGSYSVLDQENTPTGIAFNSSGTKMIIMGGSTQASQKYVHNYHLANPFDITSGVTPLDNPVNVSSFEFGPTDIAFNKNGDRMFIVGFNGDEINQFDMQVGNLTESASNDGSITGSYTLQIYDELFTNAGGTLTQGADYSISNLPTGLSSSLAVAADGKTAVLTISGTATSHDNDDEVESLQFTFENSAFSIGNASMVANSIAASSELYIEFIEAPGLTNQTFSIAENSANTTAIGTVAAIDNDGDDITFSITAGNDLGGFAIDTNSGEITVADQGDMDFETNPSFDLTVQVSDGSLTAAATITIDLTNVSEVPTDLAIDVNSIDENNGVNDVIGQLTTTDQDAAENYTYSLVSGTGDTDNASFNISSDQFRASQAFNFESKDTYNVRIQTDDGNGGLFEKAFTIIINDISEAPTDINLFGSSINENNSVDAEIGTLFTSDDDNGETHVYSLVSGTGDTDNPSFNILNDKLRASESFNFEVKDSYVIRIQTDDGNGGTFAKAFTVSVTDIAEAPTNISLSASEITENNSVNDVIGSLSSTDEDTGETFTYTLVNGTGDTDNSAFNVAVDQLRASEVFDFEANNSYSVRVQTNDGNSGILEEVFTITINNQQEAPTDIFLSSSDIDESSPVGTTVGNLNTVDEDNGETYTYTFLSGAGDTDNASFSISGNALRSAEIFDYETKTSYSVRIQTNDGNGGLFEKAFTISINNQPPGLTGIGITSNTIDENMAVGSAVGNLFSLGDEIEGVSFTFTLVSGMGDSGNGSFSIVGGQLRSLAPFDHESQNQYSIRVMADDGEGSTIEQVLLIDISDINEAPTLVDVNENEFDEGQIAGVLIDFFVDDEDTGDSHSFSLVSGAGSADNDKFEIQGQNLTNLETFNFESQSEYSIRVRATDAEGLSFESAISIFVNDANDDPTDIIISNTQIDENSSTGSAVSTISTADEDSGDSHVYSLVAGSGDADNSFFTISGNSLQTNFVPDFETKSSYFVRIQTDDSNEGIFQEAVVITISDLNEDPTNINLSSNIVEESNPIGTYVGSLSSIDEDAGQIHSYSFVSGAGDADNDSFTISGSDILSGVVFDFETKNLYTIRVQSQDGNGGSFEKSFTISINDLPASITAFELSSSSINENQSAGSAIGSFSTSGEDLSDSFTYSLISGVGDDDNSAFSISESQLLASMSLDFESKNSYRIRVMVDDGIGNTEEKIFTISVNDVSEAPTDLSLSFNTVSENNAIGDAIGQLSTIDEDAGESFSYSLVSGTGDADNVSFSIVGNELEAAEVFDFETQNSYSVRVETNDGNGGTFQKVFTISVSNENESILVSNPVADQNVDEGFTSLQIDLSPVFSDQDGDALTYLVSSSNLDIVTVSISTTNLTITEVGGFGNSTITVTADDGSGETTSEEFSVTVSNVNDDPIVANSITDQSFEEGFASSEIDLSSTFSDDDGDELTLTATSSNESVATLTLSGTTLTITEVGNGMTTVTITANDGNGASADDEFTVTVNNVNDAPIVANAITDQSADEGFGTLEIDLTNTFSDEDGDALTLGVTSSDETVATLTLSGTTLTIAEVGNGMITITITANDGNGGTVSNDFTLTVNEADNNVPTVANAIEDQSADEGFGTLEIDLTNIFSDEDGDALTLGVTSSDETVATVAIAGTTLTITEVGIGTSTITVTANDENGGSVADEFIVTVIETANNAPTLTNAITDQSADEGFGTLEIDLTNTFSDEDGDALTLGVTSSDETVATAAITGTTLTITEVGIGTSTITVTANDGNGGSVADEFTITITEAPNNAPVVANAIADQSEVEGFASISIDLTNTFSDEDGDVLTLGVTSSDKTVTTAAITGTTLTITEVGIGTSTITVTADDGNGGSVADEFTITITEEPNNAPVVANSIADQSEVEGFASISIDLTNTFSDEDGDVLTLGVTSSDETVATAEIAGATLTITEAGIGTSTITVTANDGNGGSVADEFIVTVIETANNAPTLTNAIADQSADEGFGTLEIDLTNTFSDEDGDALTLSVSSSDGTVAGAAITGTILTIAEVGIGTSTITVTANDGNGGEVSDEFIITVTGQALGLENTIAISIYPNPTTNYLNIESNKEMIVRLTDINGRELKRDNGRTVRMDVRSLAKGVYLIIVDQEGQYSKQRVIKAN